MTRALLREGPSGIVQLSTGGPARDFIPDCDLDKTLDLLFRFYRLPLKHGGTLKGAYWHEGFNWLSGQVGWLYWRVFYRFVQYRGLLDDCLSGRLKPVFANRLNFGRLYELFHPRRHGHILDPWHYGFRLPRHNRRTAAQGRPLLFYRYGPKDFRSRDLAAILDKRGVSFADVFAPSRKLLDYAAKDSPRPVYFLYRNLKPEEAFGREYDFSGLDPLEERLFRAVVPVLERRMGQMLAECRRHLDCLADKPPKLFFGLDDHNETYPALFACKTLGVPCLGYQLGMYARRQAAYALEGWEPGEYQWYDRVICWGPYWEEVLRRCSNVWPAGYFLPGANKNPYAYQRLDSPRHDPKNILIPYEFFANTKKLGEFITRFMDLGWTVSFKLKPDERPERQVDCYRLDEAHRAKLRLVTAITDELMAEINVVAGSMTTLLFDLLPYGKETWVLDTEFRLLQDMVDDGFARLVRLEDLDTLTPPAKADHQVDRDRLFNPMSLEEVLEQHVLPLL